MWRNVECLCKGHYLGMKIVLVGDNVEGCRVSA